MIIVKNEAHTGLYLDDDATKELLHQGLESRFSNMKVLVLIPDHTRSLPMPFLFKTLVNVLHDVRQLDFMVALGTHPPLDDNSLNNLVGLTQRNRSTRYKNIGLINHAWDDSGSLKTIGTISNEEVKRIAGESWHPTLGGDVQVRINKAVFNYDHIIILGPTFPHEVAGFSGGAKYLFPGISGPEMINSTHWLGALAGVVGTIGIKNTPVREMIHTAAGKLDVPVTMVALVVEGNDLAGVFIGDYLEAWSMAADLSAQRHILWYDKPFQHVLSCAPSMYDELWTAAKAMYKLEPVVAPGGSLIIYAPHLEVVSHVHGNYIEEIGYHVLDYFLKQWDRFKHVPLGVLAHSTHVRGSGTYEFPREIPNVDVTLASQIPPEICERIALNYQDPNEIEVDDWINRESEGTLYVPKAGEMLYRVRTN